MREYTVSELAQLAGVSVRTLHHYDQIGLLVPQTRTAAGYRLYQQSDLLRLQQILLYREMDVPLADIQRLLDDPGFDPLTALGEHRQHLSARIERLQRLLETVERTIEQLTEDEMPLTDKELYEGLTPEQAEQYEREARALYDPQIVAESNRRVRNMSKGEWKALQDEGDAINRELAEMMDLAPSDERVQALIARHCVWLEHFWTPTAASYEGLGQGYASDERFRAYYDRYATGLADFMAEAMSWYARHTLAKE